MVGERQTHHVDCTYKEDFYWREGMEKGGRGRECGGDWPLGTGMPEERRETTKACLPACLPASSEEQQERESEWMEFVS